MKKKYVLIVLAIALLVVFAGTGVALAKPAVYWLGGTKLTFTPSDTQMTIEWPACQNAVTAYQYDIYNPDGTWLAGSNNLALSITVTPSQEGRYQVLVQAKDGSTVVDTLKGAFRWPVSDHAKVAPSINESATTFEYVSIDSFGIRAYNYTLTFSGSPIYYRVSYEDISGNQHWFSVTKLSHQDKVAGVVSASVFTYDQIDSATFELFDRNLNVLDTYTIEGVTPAG